MLVFYTQSDPDADSDYTNEYEIEDEVIQGQQQGNDDNESAGNVGQGGREAKKDGGNFLQDLGDNKITN